MTISADGTGLAETVAGLELRTQAFVDGEYVDAANGETFDCVSPRSGTAIAAVAACDSVDVDAAAAGFET